MIQKREAAAFVTPPLISLDFNLSQDNDIRREFISSAVKGYTVILASSLCVWWIMCLESSRTKICSTLLMVSCILEASKHSY